MEDQDYLIHYGVLGMKWGVRRDRSGSSGSKLSRRKTKKEIKKVNKSLANNERRTNYQKNLNTSYKKDLADLKKNKFNSKVFKYSWNDGYGTWALPTGKGKNWLNANFDDIDVTITSKPTKAQKQRGYDYLEHNYKKAVSDGKKSLEKLNKERDVLNRRLDALTKKNSK